MNQPYILSKTPLDRNYINQLVKEKLGMVYFSISESFISETLEFKYTIIKDDIVTFAFKAVNKFVNDAKYMFF